MTMEKFMEIKRNAMICAESYLRYNRNKNLFDFIDEFNYYDNHSEEFLCFLSLVIFPDIKVFHECLNNEFKKDINKMSKTLKIPFQILVAREVTYKKFEAKNNDLEISNIGIKIVEKNLKNIKENNLINKTIILANSNNKKLHKI